MYLTFERYGELGGDTWDEGGFGRAERLAESILDDVTLGRLHHVDWSPWSGEVERAMLVALESVPALRGALAADLSGEREVTSFSNGVNSFSFSSGEGGQMQGASTVGALEWQLRMLLPADLCSSCVGWNHAR